MFVNYKITAMLYNKIPSRTGKFKLVEISSVDDRCVSNLKSILSLKQEVKTDECPHLSKFLHTVNSFQCWNIKLTGMIRRSLKLGGSFLLVNNVVAVDT